MWVWDLVSRGRQIFTWDIDLVSRGSHHSKHKVDLEPAGHNNQHETGILYREDHRIFTSDLVSRGSPEKNVSLRSCIERITNLQWRYRSCIKRIITPNIRSTLNQRATPINMRPGSCIERITVSSLETLYREGLLKTCEFKILYREDHESSLEILYREDHHCKHKVDHEPAAHT